MKTRLSLLFAVVFLPAIINGQNAGNAVTDVILSGYSVRNYTTEPVTDQQLETILRCGIKAPSARNGQPWRFTVVRDEAMMKGIIKDAVAGNVLIIISGADSQQPGINAAFDCGLATYSMFVAAQGLGLGARIYGSPVAGVTEKRENYQIPAGFKPVMILRIGNRDKSIDAVSAATPRKKYEEIVNFR